MLEKKIINDTSLSFDQVQKLKKYGGFINVWNQRYVELYQPSVEYLQTHPNTVISLSYSPITHKYWICEEPFGEYEARIIAADWIVTDDI